MRKPLLNKLKEQRKLGIGQTVIFQGNETRVRGYYKKDEKLYIIENNRGWFGWCILKENDVKPDHQVLKRRKYNLAYEFELKKVG